MLRRSFAPDEEVPGQMDRALERLKEIHHLVMNSAGACDVDATLQALDIVEGQTCVGSPSSLARGMLCHLYGCVFHRADRKEESIAAGTEALRIDALTPFLAGDERAQLLCRIARQAVDLSQWDLAIACYEKAIPLFDANPAIEKDLRVLLRRCLDFCLREAGRPHLASSGCADETDRLPRTDCPPKAAPYPAQ